MTVEEALLNFISTYGVSILVISVLVIFIIGILKYFNVFGKIKSANTKKFIYYLLDIVLSFGFVAIYYAINDLSFITYLNYGFKTVTAVTAIYAIYENFGLRKLLQALGTCFINFVAKKQIEDAKTAVTTNKTQKKDENVSRETLGTSKVSVSSGTAINNIGK